MNTVFKLNSNTLTSYSVHEFNLGKFMFEKLCCVTEFNNYI